MARLRIHGLTSRRPAIVVRSGTDGRFHIELTPGEYVVRALPEHGSPLPRPPQPFDVQVKPGRFTRVTVTYDTGIR